MIVFTSAEAESCRMAICTHIITNTPTMSNFYQIKAITNIMSNKLII